MRFGVTITRSCFLNRYPALRGYALVAPIEHKRFLINDLDIDEYIAVQRLVYRVGRAVSAVVPTERLYVLSLGSNQGNDHIHWHVAPLPPGTPYSEQQYHSLMLETSGYITMSDEEHASLGHPQRSRHDLAPAPHAGAVAAPSDGASSRSPLRRGVDPPAAHSSPRSTSLSCRAKSSKSLPFRVISGRPWRTQQAATHVSFCGRGRPRRRALAARRAQLLAISSS